MIVPGYAQFGGRHCETGSLKNVLAHYRVTAPHTGRPFSEEMLFGIGGGIGISYWLFEFGEDPFFFIGGRYGEPKTLMIQQVCDRLGLAASLCETGSAKRGAADLEAVLGASRPAPVWVDMPQLPYLALPERAHFGGHVIVVYGIDDQTGEALIADRGAGPFRATLADLAAARGSTHKPFPPRHKLLEVAEPEEPVSPQTLERAVLRGISDACRQLLRGPIENIGLRALEKWARLLTDERNPKGWPRVFRRPASLAGALMSTYIFIEIGGTGGSAFRSMYAAFLDEAAVVLRENRLAALAVRYRECARLWSAVSSAALPDSLPPFRRTRELLAEKNRVFEQQKEGALARMTAINLELDRVFGDAVRDASARDALPGLRDAILEVHAAETASARELEACLR
jgi:hypothetical protein